MNSGNRTPIIVVIACAVVAGLVLFLGIGFGGGNDDAAADWQSGFSGIAAGGALTTADLAAAGGSCSASGSQLTVAGSCTFTVREFGGLFGPPTKRARLLPQHAVVVVLEVEGTRSERTAGAGDTVNLTFGTGGGTLGVRCGALGTCLLNLAEAD
ncbi:hypothetical protein BIU82_12195 [Arthrobacter sp. SW1]|uniref:hypothetical protein n=1 Tax=Arthrobacter sp. SW1 TaxID=1920889 RepID=UPI000877D049|nr:hypothetical protein [Arthrobacter sp. SW1]OFI36822.1 hypothetical protein BIU82_12195 [Arthrobacter sp. SW1]